MKKIFLSAVILLTTQLLLAQTDSVSNIPKGKFALQFQVQKDFSISSFQGSILSGKYFFKNGNSLRAGLSLAVNTQDENASESVNDSTTLNNSLNTKQYSAVFISQYLFYFHGFENIYFYAGAGPYFGYFSNKTSPQPSGNYSERKRLSLGISAVLGVEWFFNKRFSLSAEYGALGYHEKTTESYLIPYTRLVKKHVNTENKIFSFSGSTKLGISIYF
jgi:hypothetical protein